MEIGLGHYLILAATLFTLGVLGIFLNRKNVIVILMSIELMLLAVNINLVAFSVFLHDLVGQSLALCNIKLGSLLEQDSSALFTQELNEIRDLISQMIKEIRSLSFTISSPLLYEFGLDAAIEQLAEEMQKQYGLVINFRCNKQARSPGNDIRVIIFRLVRELFTNILKHAQAHYVEVLMEQHKEYLKLVIEDDGVGFKVSQLHSRKRKGNGFGLFSIRERLSYIGGKVEIKSKPGKGTKITITVPLKKESKDLIQV